MASPADHDRRQALYDAYCAVPEHQRAEIIDGTLYVMPRPAPRHANATTILGSDLNAAFQRGRGGPGGWWILFEPELQLVDREPMSPDLAGWRVERLPTLPEIAYFSIAPDWIVALPGRPLVWTRTYSSMARWIVAWGCCACAGSGWMATPSSERDTSVS